MCVCVSVQSMKGYFRVSSQARFILTRLQKQARSVEARNN